MMETPNHEEPRKRPPSIGFRQTFRNENLADRATEIRKRFLPRHRHISQEKAEIYGEEVERLAEELDRPVTAEDWVEAAKDPESPLHGSLTADIEQAAHLYHLVEARKLLRSIEVEITYVLEEEEDEVIRVPAFHRVTVADEDGPEKGDTGYVPAERALDDRALWTQITTRALRELQSWRKLYGHLLDVEAKNWLDDVEDSLRGGADPSGGDQGGE